MFRIHPNDLTSHGKHFFLLRSSGRGQPMTLDVKHNGDERSFTVHEGFVVGDGGMRLSAILPTEGTAFMIESPDELLPKLAQPTPAHVSA